MGAFSNPVQNISVFAANADLSANQFYAVKLGSNGKLALCGAGEAAMGILQDKPVADGFGTVMTVGVTKAKAGGTIAAGAMVMSNAAGKMVTATGTNAVVGLAMSAAADGDIFSVLMVARNASGVLSPVYETVHLGHHNLAEIADGNIVTGRKARYAGLVVGFFAQVSSPATTAAKASTLNLEIGGTNVTGGALALTSANMTPKGAIVEATAITANNAVVADDLVDVEAASTTAFVEGEIDLYMVIQPTA